MSFSYHADTAAAIAEDEARLTGSGEAVMTPGELVEFAEMAAEEFDNDVESLDAGQRAEYIVSYIASYILTVAQLG
jgi:hypothetical protein